MDTFQEVVDNFGLELSTSINPVSTQYVDNSQDSNSVLDLIFLRTRLEKFNNYTISLVLQSLSDHTSLSVSIIIEKEFIQEKKKSIVRNSNKEKEFVNELRYRIDSMATSNITNCEILKHITQEFTFIIEDFWNKFSKLVSIIKRSKA